MTLAQQVGLPRAAARALTVVALVGIGIATLSPSRGPAADPAFGCVFCGERWVADVLLNVLLYIPLGVALGLRDIRLLRAVLLGAFCSAGVEFTQLFLANRDPSIGDVLANAAGVAGGRLAARLAPRVAALPSRFAALLSVAAVGDLAIAVFVTGWLLQPSFPTSVYWGQWTPRLGHLEWYRGRIHSATLDGVEVRPRRIDDSRWARAALLRGAPVEVRFLAGPPVPRLAPIFSVADEEGRGIFLLGADRGTLVLRFRTHAAALHLDQPDVRSLTPGATLAAGAATVVRAWRSSRGTWCLETPRARDCPIGHTVGAGWTVLYYPEGMAPWLRRGLGAVWVAVLLTPLGFLARARRESAIAAVLAALVLAVLPGLAGLRPTPAIEWLGGALGVAVGTAARVTARRGALSGGP